MDVYTLDDYKSIVRLQVKQPRKSHPRLTLKKLADKIGIQYTYLSKALNDERAHLGEDHLFNICRLLGLFPEEIDYVLLLRSLAITSDPARREYIQEKLNRIRRARQVKASLQEFNTRQLAREMDYLFDPLCLIIMIALNIKEYRQEPRSLCPLLGVTPSEIQVILRKLRDLGFIEMSEDNKTITKILKQSFHYGTDHPLMRVHQALLRSLSSTHVHRASEEDKHSFMATFSADEETFKKVREKFQAFVTDVQKISTRAQDKAVYQMNFDLFRWL